MAAGDYTVAQGTPICWADETDYVSTNSGISRTHQIDLTGLIDGDMWQGEKADLGATRAGSYSVKVCWEPASAPTAGLTIEYYWCSSYVTTAGTGNDGGAESAGADSDWDGVSGGSETERDEYKKHLTWLGTLVLGADAVYQVKTLRQAFQPPTRFGFPIVKNNSGVAAQSDADEMYIALIPNAENVEAA